MVSVNARGELTVFDDDSERANGRVGSGRSVNGGDEGGGGGGNGNGNGDAEGGTGGTGGGLISRWCGRCFGAVTHEFHMYVRHCARARPPSPPFNCSSIFDENLSEF